MQRSQVMERVIQQELSQDNPHKQRRLEKFKQVLERERRAEYVALARVILDNCPGFLSVEDPLERKDIILRYSIFSMMPESTSNDKFRLFVESWMAVRYEIADRTMKKYGWDKLPFEERDAAQKVLLHDGEVNE